MSPRQISKADVRRTIAEFLAGTGGRWDWDDFISIRLKDPELERVRQIAGALPGRFPPDLTGGYCSDEGREVLRQLLDDPALRE
jgi:hypothetical protein